MKIAHTMTHDLVYIIFMSILTFKKVGIGVFNTYFYIYKKTYDFRKMRKIMIRLGFSSVVLHTTCNAKYRIVRIEKKKD